MNFKFEHMEKFNDFAKSEKPVLVEFFAGWCIHCQRMRPILDEVEACFKDKIRVLRFDVEAPENSRVVTFYHIRSIPMFMLFKEGKILWQQGGEMQRGELNRVLLRYQ